MYIIAFMGKTEDKRDIIFLGKWTEKKLNSVLREASKIKGTGERIEFLSSCFLETPYKEYTLIGDVNTQEVFVINLGGVDCFTFIDYIEAMRLAASFSEFKENLKRVRYQSGKIQFENRSHFFTDWIEFNTDLVQDVTEQIGGQNTINIQKVLNIKEDGTYFLQGIQPKRREIKYIPSDVIAKDIDNSIINKLKTGDYVGIYSHAQGLDVSHVGIVIKNEDKIYLRHASSVKMKVIDEDFKNYMSDKPGLIVLRPKD